MPRRGQIRYAIKERGRIIGTVESVEGFDAPILRRLVVPSKIFQGRLWLEEHTLATCHAWGVTHVIFVNAKTKQSDTMTLDHFMAESHPVRHTNGRKRAIPVTSAFMPKGVERPLAKNLPGDVEPQSEQLRMAV